MFHWICPECGREIPPAVKECPACDRAEAPVAAVSAEPEIGPDVLLVLAEEIREVHGLLGLAAVVGTGELSRQSMEAAPDAGPKTREVLAAVQPAMTAVALVAAPASENGRGGEHFEAVAPQASPPAPASPESIALAGGASSEVVPALT